MVSEIFFIGEKVPFDVEKSSQRIGQQPCEDVVKMPQILRNGRSGYSKRYGAQ